MIGNILLHLLVRTNHIVHKESIFSSAITPSSFINNKYNSQLGNWKRKLKCPFLNMKFISVFNAT